MENGNETHLDVVFADCKNDFDLFLVTIANYLAKKPNFDTYNCKRISAQFEDVQTAAKKSTASVHLNTADHAKSTNGTNSAPIVVSEDHDSMFGGEEETDDNIIIPETQFFDESDESAITIEIGGDTNDDSNSSEFALVNPGSQVDDYSEQQSQAVINMNESVRNMLREIDEENRHQSQDEALPTSTIEANSKRKGKSNESNSDDGDSRSTTPDLDFMIGSTRDEGHRTAVQQKDDEETQMFCDNLLDEIAKPASPQSVPHVSQHEESSDDIFLAATQMYTAKVQSSTPRSKAKQNIASNNNDDDEVFDAATQQVSGTKFLQPAPVNRSTERSKETPKAAMNNEAEDDVFEAATQQFSETEFLRPAPVNRSTRRSKDKPNAFTNNDNNDDDEVFDAATQNAADMEFLRPADVNKGHPQSKVTANTSTIDDEDEVFGAATQIVPDNDVYAAATQALPLDEPTVAKKSVTWKPSEQSRPQKSNAHNTSDDLFDVATQLIDEPEKDNSNEDLNATEVFDMPTQMLEVQENPQRNRLPAVLTQSSQPANTPEWSLAARITDEQIDRFEKEQEERDEQKRRAKLQKNRYLFVSSSDDEDDLDFDLARPVSTEIGNREAFKRRPSTETSKRSHTDTDPDEGPPPKKPDVSKVVIPKNILERRLSVKVSASEVDEMIRKGKTAMKVKSTQLSRTKSTDSRAAETKIIQSESTRERSLRTRNQEQKKNEPVAEVGTRQSKRKQEAIAREQLQAREKRHKESEKQKTSTTASSKPKDDDAKPRNGRKAKENSKAPPVFTKYASPSDNSSLEHIKRRNSERISSRKFIRRAILFTKVNSAPYAKSIQDLGGYIVDTPQLGDVLICDKISRTFKFLYALSKGIPIVTSQWLDMSIKNGTFVDYDPHLVVDKTSEKRFHFNLKNSLESARQKPLFTNYHIFATPHVQPTTDEISEIVQCSGGKFATNLSDTRKPNTKAVLISHKKDSKMWHLYQKVHPDIQIVSCEGFMLSVCQQKINFPDFVLA